MRRSIKNKWAILCLVLVCGTVFSCMSVPKDEDVPEDATAADITQKAQEAVDGHNYRAAHAYYAMILKRFESDEAVCVAAEFEIAHLFVKKHKWKKAYPLLESILEKYELSSGITLPPEYYKLAKIDYERVKEKIKK